MCGPDEHESGRCHAKVMACGQALARAIYDGFQGFRKGKQCTVGVISIRKAVLSAHIKARGSAEQVGLTLSETRTMQVGMSMHVDALAASRAESRSLGCLRHHQHRTGLTNLRQHSLLANAQLTSDVLSSSGQLRGCRVYEHQPARVHRTVTCQATPLDVRANLDCFSCAFKSSIALPACSWLPRVQRTCSWWRRVLLQTGQELFQKQQKRCTRLKAFLSSFAWNKHSDSPGRRQTMLLCRPWR